MKASNEGRVRWVAFVGFVAFAGCGQQDPLNHPGPDVELAQTPVPEELGQDSTGQDSTGQDCSPADPNAEIFDHAVCVCENLGEIGNGLSTESISALLGGPSHHEADVGVNGSAGAIGNMFIDGVLDVRGDLGAIGNVRVKNDFLVGGNLTNAGRVVVDTDVNVGGDMSGVGYFRTKESLSVSGNLLYFGALFHQSIQQGNPFPVHTPCPCNPEDLINVAALVEQNQGAQAIPLASGIGNNEITLHAGDFYSADGSHFIGNSIIRVAGAVRLFIEDNVDTIGNRMFKLEDGAEIDIYISGSLRTIGNILVGTPANDADSRAVRFYVGGDDSVTIDVVGNEIFRGAVYAPQADVHFIGNMVVRGAIFARNIYGIGNLMVFYNGGITGEECPPEGPEGPA